MQRTELTMPSIKHGVVYKEQGIYAGWPANHGAWQWGNEFLVGFLRGKYGVKSMHHILEPFELAQARSTDGGKTWIAESVSIPVDVIGEQTTAFDCAKSIVRVRGSYDHGGDFIDPPGCYYASEDKGRSWHGPHGFVGIDWASNDLNTSRTRVLGDLFFMSKADARMWGTDEVFCARHLNGEFRTIGTVASDKARAVMPAVARIGKMIVSVCRRRISNRYGGWIEAFGSDDDGKNWRSLGEVGETGKNNGNPPAIIERDGHLICVYGNRTDCQIIARTSLDGAKWSEPIVLRESTESDIGYPQLFKREDGTLVAVYYWADSLNRQQHIAYTEFSV